jgi:hypothetical protein
MVFFLAACGTSAHSPEPAATPVPVPADVTPLTEANPDEALKQPGDPATVQTLLGEGAGVEYLGDWTSPPCDGRSYARNVTFYPNQEYAVMELVSPCPVGTQCMWSGLGTFAGLWGQDGKKLRVQEISMTGNSPGGPHPVYFEATDDGRLAENGCFYTKGLTVPPGYTEEQVRAKIPGKKPGAPVAATPGDPSAAPAPAAADPAAPAP